MIGQKIEGYAAFDDDGDRLIVAETREQVANWLDSNGFFATPVPATLVWIESPLSGMPRLAPIESPAAQEALA